MAISLVGVARVSADEIDDIIARAQALNRSKEPDARKQAVKVLRDAIEACNLKTIDDPRDAASFYGLSRLHTELSEDPSALQAIDQALRLQPANVDYLNQQVTVLLYAGKFKEAIPPLEKLVELVPDNARYAERLAAVYVKAKDYTSAAKTYRALLTKPEVMIAPQHAGELQGMLGHTLRMAGQTDEAIAVLEPMLMKDMQNAGVLVELGICYEAKGQLDRATEHYAQALAASPDSENALEHSASVAAQQQRTADFDKFRQSLLELHKARKTQQAGFERDAFKVGTRYEVRVYELYELTGPKAVRYHFDVTDRSGKEPFRITLGSYDLTTQVMQAQGVIDATGRAWHLDLYRGRDHETYGMFPSEPTYDHVRTMVVEILEGTRGKLSGSGQPANPGGPTRLDLPSGKR